MKTAAMTETVIRVPVIPGCNADKGSIQSICAYVKLLEGVKTIHLLPYHDYGENKYQLVGREYPLKGVHRVTEADVAPLKQVVQQAGFTCQIGG